MFEKNMKIAYLLDFYEGLLDQHTAEIMKQYYNDDLSLAEIASGFGISRQGVRHLIKKGEEQIEFFDSKLQLSSKHSDLNKAVTMLREISESLSDMDADEGVARIEKVIAIITKGN